VKTLSKAEVRAALSATFIVFLATSILWMGALSELFHWTQAPRWVVLGTLFLTVLGSPGYVLKFLPFPKNDGLLLAKIVVSWIYYFVILRWFFLVRQRRSHRKYLREQQGGER
jgi:hypothetical protein